MSKQSPSRNQRSKGFKVKHVLQICLLLAIGIWLLNQLKHSYDNKTAYDDSADKTSEKVQNEHEIIKFGRKDLHPRVEETMVIESQGDKEELEEEIEEIKPEEIEDEGRGGGDDEIDGHEQERAEEEESEEAEDLIDVDDRDANQLDDASLHEDQAQNDAKRYFREAREAHYRDDDASNSVVQNTQTTEIGALRTVKEKEIENAEDVALEQENKSRGIKEVIVDMTDSHSEVGNKVTIEYGDGGKSVHGEGGDEFHLGNLDDGSNSGFTISESIVPEPIKKIGDGAVLDGNSTPATIIENNGTVNSEGSETISNEAAENAEKSSALVTTMRKSMLIPHSR